MLECPTKPEKLVKVPLGMFHCPLCGMMVVAGVPHPLVYVNEEPEAYTAIARWKHEESLSKLRGALHTISTWNSQF